MHTRYIAALALQPFLITTAQTSFEDDMSTDLSRNDVSAALMNITFFASTTSEDCSSSNSDIDSSSDRSNQDNTTLSISIRTIPLSHTCFNLGNTFSDPDSNYTVQGEKCEKGQQCGVNYTITAHGFSTNLNYSRVFYTQVRNPLAGLVGLMGQNYDDDNDNNDNDDDRRGNNSSSSSNGSSSRNVAVGGRLEFETFNGPNCHDKNDEVSRKWNCLSEQGECTTLPFSVQSFAIAMTEPELVGHSNCTIAAESNDGVAGWSRSGGMQTAVMVALGLIGLAMFL